LPPHTAPEDDSGQSDVAMLGQSAAQHGEVEPDTHCSPASQTPFPHTPTGCDGPEPPANRRAPRVRDADTVVSDVNALAVSKEPEASARQSGKIVTSSVTEIVASSRVANRRLVAQANDCTMMRDWEIPVDAETLPANHDDKVAADDDSRSESAAQSVTTEAPTGTLSCTLTPQVSEYPPHTPHASTPAVQHMPWPSRSPAQQRPPASTNLAEPPQTPHASNASGASQHAPFTSIRPCKQHCCPSPEGTSANEPLQHSVALNVELYWRTYFNVPPHSWSTTSQAEPE
jgi:hypothetical protein